MPRALNRAGDLIQEVRGRQVTLEDMRHLVEQRQLSRAHGEVGDQVVVSGHLAHEVLASLASEGVILQQVMLPGTQAQRPCWFCGEPRPTREGQRLFVRCASVSRL